MGSLTKEWVRYGDRQQYLGYLTYPTRAALPLPAVLVIQEAWGVDRFIESVSHRLALSGYVAFAPDLYAVEGERPALLTRERVAELQGFVNELPHGVWQDQPKREPRSKRCRSRSAARYGTPTAHSPRPSRATRT